MFVKFRSVYLMNLAPADFPIAFLFHFSRVVKNNFSGGNLLGFIKAVLLSQRVFGRRGSHSRRFVGIEPEYVCVSYFVAFELVLVRG